MIESNRPFLISMADGRDMNTFPFFVVLGIVAALSGCDSRQLSSGPETPAPGETLAEVQRREGMALESNWSLVSVTMSGKTVETPGGSISFAGGKMILTDPGGATTTYRYRIDPLTQPKSIEMTDAQNTNAPPRYAIYELNGEGLRLCLGGEGKPPTAFDADGGRVFLLHRK